MKFIYVRRLKDGIVFDIPEKDLAETLKRGGFEEISDVQLKGVVHEAPILEVTNECPICGFTAKSEFGLKVHKRKHL